MRRLWLLLLLVTACTGSPPPNTSGLEAVSPVPTLDTNNPVLLCETVNAQWSRDWPTVIRALEALATLDETCGFDVRSRLYTAHIAFGTLLEGRGQREEAVRVYVDALGYNPNGAEAVRRLRLLNAFTPEPLERCDPQVVSQTAMALPEYAPSSGVFVTVRDGQLWLDGAPYTVYGVNYYPRDYPGWRFLTEMNVDSLAFEMEILQAAGFNTLRVFIQHDELFTCPGDGAVPVLENLARLDAFIQLAAVWDFKLILVLNHQPDLARYPLYDAPTHTMNQMAFLARRYSAEPAVLAYDLRAGGDADYETDFTRTEVLAWLAAAARLVRENAPDQLITAGWDDDSEVTAPLVDFLSFQHTADDIAALRQEIAVLTNATTRPVLLAAVGYNTFALDEVGQRLAYQRALEAAARNNLAGWVVTTAFDYPPLLLCDDPDNCPERSPQNQAGLWTTSYFPKLALEVIQRAADG